MNTGMVLSFGNDGVRCGVSIPFILLSVPLERRLSPMLLGH